MKWKRTRAIQVQSYCLYLAIEVRFLRVKLRGSGWAVVQEANVLADKHQSLLPFHQHHERRGRAA